MPVRHPAGRNLDLGALGHPRWRRGRLCTAGRLGFDRQRQGRDAPRIERRRRGARPGAGGRLSRARPGRLPVPAGQRHGLPAFGCPAGTAATPLPSEPLSDSGEASYSVRAPTTWPGAAAHRRAASNPPSSHWPSSAAPPTAGGARRWRSWATATATIRALRRAAPICSTRSMPPATQLRRHRQVAHRPDRHVGSLADLRRGAHEPGDNRMGGDAGCHRARDGSFRRFRRRWLSSRTPRGSRSSDCPPPPRCRAAGAAGRRPQGGPRSAARGCRAG